MRASTTAVATPQPYNDMALTSFKHFYQRRPRKICQIFEKYVWTVLALFFLLAGLPALAAELPFDSRSAALMPWQLLGLDPEFSSRHREQLQRLHQSIEAAWLEQAQPLDQQAQKAQVKLSLNERQLAQTIRVGRSRAALSEPYHLQPLICPVGDQLLFALELVSTRPGLLLAASQILLPRAPWEQWQKPGPPPTVPKETWQKLLQQLWDAAANPPTSRRDSPFKLRLGLLRGSHDNRLGSHLCLNALTAHALLDSLAILPAIGERESVHLRRVWGEQEPMQRGNRELLLDWGMSPQGNDLTATARWSEAVLGSSINVPASISVRLDPAAGRLEPPDALIRMLQGEAQSMSREDWPQVAKIYGAWAYLDRGRAWGLEMNDRLYLDDGQRLIKGHVVGFYGSGLGLKSPRGFPIHEGAILFIRKGQKIVRIGDVFHFDPTRFPTPWPPVRQPPQASVP